MFGKDPTIRRLFEFEARVLGVCEVDRIDIDRRLVKKLVLEYLTSHKPQEVTVRQEESCACCGR
jgi:hypothetical protein